MPRFYTTHQAAEMLHYSYQRVMQMLAQGKIRGIKPGGGAWRIPATEIERLQKGEPVAESPAEYQERQRQLRKPPVHVIEVEEGIASRVLKQSEVPVLPTDTPIPEPEHVKEEPKEEPRSEPAESTLKWSFIGR